MHDAILRQARAPQLKNNQAEGNQNDSVEHEGEKLLVLFCAVLCSTFKRLCCVMPVFRPEERVSFAEALWMYTVGAAFAANCEHVLGQVRVKEEAQHVCVLILWCCGCVI